MKLITLFFTLCICCIMHAQNIKVDSCLLSKTDSTWLLYPKMDNNGHPTSIIKIVNKNFNGKLKFKGNIIDELFDENKSIYTLYVLEKTKRLTVYHSDHIPETVDFTIFNDSKYGLEHNKVYYLYLSAQTGTQSSDSSTPNGSRVLSFSSNTVLKSLYVDGYEWKIIDGKSSKKLISYGIHRYEAINIDGSHIKGEIDLQPSIGSKIIKLDFNQ